MLELALAIRFVMGTFVRLVVTTLAMERMRGWLLGAAASLRGKGSRDEVLLRSPPLADLGKACAKFNGRSKLNNDKLIPSLSIRRGQFEI